MRRLFTPRPSRNWFVGTFTFVFPLNQWETFNVNEVEMTPSGKVFVSLCRD